MATKQQWGEFVQALRARQDELRAEARPFEEGKIFVGQPLPDGLHVDMTKAHIKAIKGEIASLEKTIQKVIAEQGLGNACRSRSMRIATGEETEELKSDRAKRAAAELESRGGKARAVKMSPERRIEVAKKAAKARWRPP